MARPGALANLDYEDALDRMATGVLSKAIAAEYGVSPYGLRKRLAQHPDYKAAIAEQSHSIVEHAMEELMECPHDVVAIARARAKVDGAMRYAKAHNPAYADKQQVEHTASGPLINIVLAGTVAQTPIVHDSTEQLVHNDDKP